MSIWKQCDMAELEAHLVHSGKSYGYNKARDRSRRNNWPNGGRKRRYRAGNGMVKVRPRT